MITFSFSFFLKKKKNSLGGKVNENQCGVGPGDEGGRGKDSH